MYRNSSNTICRPEISIDFKIHDLISEVGQIADEDVDFNITLLGSLLSTRVQANRTDMGFLIPIKWTFTHQGKTQHLLQTPEHAPRAPDLETNTYWSIHSKALNEAGWSPVSAAWEGQLQGTQQFTGLYTINNPLTRSISLFSGKVFFLKAARNPDYTPKNSHVTLSLATQDQLTELLQRLSFDIQKFKIMSDAVSLLFDDVQELVLSELSNHIAPHCKFVDGRLTPVADVGYGLRNVIQILTVISLAQEGAIILIDEPEQGLNQSKQRDFSKILELLRSDVTIVMATQSEAFCKGLETSNIYLAETEHDKTFLSLIDIKGNHQHRKRMAKVMGISALFLVEGGKIIFVEGPSDKEIIGDWISRNLPSIRETEYEVHDLGGSGKLGCEFAKPMFLNFKEKIFFLLDSDRSASSNPGPNIRALTRWLDENKIETKYVLNKREIENYIGVDAIAAVSTINVNARHISPPTGALDYFDFKEAVKNQKGFYDEMKMTLPAYRSLPEEKKKNLFGSENNAILEKLRVFLSEG